MKVKRIHHIGITVNNLEKTVNFYKNIMGLKLLVPPTEPSPEIENGKPVGVDGAVIRTCLFEVSDNQILEFLEYQSESEIKGPIPMNTIGAHHLSLSVDNIDGFVEKLKKYGIEFLYKPLEIEKGYLKGTKWVYFKDPEGIIVELMEEPYIDI